MDDQQLSQAQMMGEVLAKISKIEAEMSQVLAAQKADDQDRARRHGASRVFQIVGGALFTILLALSGFYGGMIHNHESRLVNAETRLEQVREDLKEHTSGPGHEPTRTEVGSIRADLQTLTATVAQATRAHEKTAEEQAEAIQDLGRSLERLRR